jgi:hypothetical protein
MCRRLLLLACVWLVASPALAQIPVDSELAAAAAAADTFANPTTAPTLSFLMRWNGTTWDRWDGVVTVTDGAGALNVICDSGCGGGSQYVEDAPETAGSNLTMAGTVRRDTAASSAGTAGDNATLNTDATGRLWVTGDVTASATDLDVQSGGADLATTTQAAAIETAVEAIQTAAELIDNAVSGSGFNISQIGGVAPTSARCDDDAKITTVNINLTAGTGNTEIVALTTDDVVYACGWSLQVGGADTTQWITGTGTACATGETDKITYGFAADGDGISVPNTGHVQWKTAASAAVCLERTSSVSVVGYLAYVKE